MDEKRLRLLFPNASRDFLALNADDSQLSLPIQVEGSNDGKAASASAKLERGVGNGALGEGQAQKGDTGRFLVRVTSVRRRLIDEDNLCEKYVVDCCRYAGLIPNDGPGKTTIQATQRKAGKEEAEHTIVEIFAIG